MALLFFLLFYLVDKTRFNVTAVILIGVILIQVIFLIRYVERTNRKLSQFLQSIKHSDFSSSFTDQGLGKSFDDLNRSFMEVIEEFKKYRAEKEENFYYLQTVVQHVSIGIIAYSRNGKVDLFNNAIKRLLKVRNVRFISDLESVKEGLPETLLNLKAGERTLIRLSIKDELLQISAYATEFRMRGEDYILVSLQDISSELDEKEIESWQKLIRVLTHEITNSITPISSLAATVREMLLDEDKDELLMKALDKDDLEGVQSAINTIQKRSQGLLNFVEVYRNLTRIPKPSFRYFKVSEIFERSQQLLIPKMNEMGISCSNKVFPPDMMVTADPDLIDQVMINMVLNAMDAVKGKKDAEISILATVNNNSRVVVDIKDNGVGIKPDILDKIFMPFFTSKKHGSGIGLSLSRQIMHLHKGFITVRSKPGEGTTFSITF
ncbi:MAG: HAMP domain-containing histidine kinase [Bacteroidales bacterium]|nr:HAMP domain-containing histidine kinase [Bacteroidales bacterium]